MGAVFIVWTILDPWSEVECFCVFISYFSPQLFTYLNPARIRSLVAGMLVISDLDIITKLDPMGSNETSLLLVMTIIMLHKSVKLNVRSMRSCVASLLWQEYGSRNSRSESYRMFSSFAEKINLVLKWATEINDMQIYELSNSYPRP